MDRPRRVSVVVPTRNRPDLLREALTSIRALEADDLAFEILVADNGSSPRTRHVAEDLDAVYLPVSEGVGPSVARNLAMACASGDYIAFLDDDDAWLPTQLRAHLDHLDANPQHEAVLGQVVTADHKMKPLSEPWPLDAPRCSRDLLRRMLSGYFPQIGAVVARTRVREQIGGFDEKLTGGEDLDWLLRLARKDQLGFTATPGVLFRSRRRDSYDDIQLERAKYDRKVFLRHALPEWRLWRSPMDFMNAYYGSLRHFYVYFTNAAINRAARGEGAAARRAVAGAFSVFPFRAAYHVLRGKRLGAALWGSFARKRKHTRRGTRLEQIVAPALLVAAERLEPYAAALGI